MKRRNFLLAAGLLLALAAGFLFRPITIAVDGTEISLRGPLWTTGQAVQAAGITVWEGDQVTPALEAPLPLAGRVTIQRAARVLVWDNGSIREVAGAGRTPAALLDAAGIALAPADRLIWNGQVVSAAMILPYDRTIVLQIERAAPYTLDVDGSPRSIEAHGPTVAHLLWSAGIQPGPGDRLSAPPGSAPETAQAVGYQAARLLTVEAGGIPVRFRTAARTVGEALAGAGMTLHGLDYAQPGEDQPLPADGIIRVVRVREDILLTETLTPYESSFAPDPATELDARRIVQAGQYGVQVTRERVRYEDGQEVQRAVDSDWTASQAVNETIGFGTNVVVQTADMPDGTIEYWRKVHVYATSYSPCRLGTGDGRCGYTTASGARLTKGIVAVPRTWFRQMNGQRVYIPGYGFGVIADTGGMRGMHIDLGFDEENFEAGAIVGWVDLYFLTPVPANIPWTLP